MVVLHGALLLAGLIIVTRLFELQLLRGAEFHDLAQAQHFGGVTLPARRGEILSLNSKTGETSILATNITLDLVYVDPVINDNPTLVASTLAEVLVTEQVHEQCSSGSSDCPRELIEYYAGAYDPLRLLDQLGSGAILEPVNEGPLQAPAVALPDIGTVRGLFTRSIEERISEKRVRFMPLIYGANKKQLQEVSELGIGGITVNRESRLIYADPEEVDQGSRSRTARRLAGPLEMDADQLSELLRSRPLRYVPVMRRLSPETSQHIRSLQEEAEAEAQRRREAAATREEVERIVSTLRSVALIPEHWRYYPDGLVGSHVVGFLNATQEAQYGIERTFNPQLRGQEGRIATLSDPQGGQILTSQQTIVEPRDGDTIVLTIDRFVQKRVEEILNTGLEEYNAESAQAIVMEPNTGRIIAMANAPLFDSNDFGDVYEKAPIYLSTDRQRQVVVEIYHPQTNAFVIKGYVTDIFTGSGRQALSPERQEALESIEELYNLRDVARYYLYIGENYRREIFPTERPDVWLQYGNNLGVGAYLNRTIQEIYEPGSVQKAMTMAIAIDQGEVTPEDRYDDKGPVEVDEYVIKNALLTYYGSVTMTNCLEFSINTCMTSVSDKLGAKLLHEMLQRFGYSKITGIELEDELPGDLLPWMQWSRALLATAAFGQGISATPLQVITAFSALANDGQLIRPTVVDRVIHSDGTVDVQTPHLVDQVIRPESAETITAMLISAVERGFAKPAKVPGYRIAGKTGTSQIAGPGGKYETGTGSTIASFAGYAPALNPKFSILIKFDRPQKVIHGASTAAPVFNKIAAFLLDYYGIPPDENLR